MAESRNLLSRFRAQGSSDEGFTLIELLIYIVISGVVLSVVASMLFSLFSVQTKVNTSTTGASAAQVTASSIKTGVRNSTAVKLETQGSSQFLVVRTLTPDDDISGICQAWWYTPDNGGSIKVSYGQSANGWPDPLTPSKWTLLISGVQAPVGSNIFSLVASTVSLDFITTGTAGSQTHIDTSVSSGAATTVSSPCY